MLTGGPEYYGQGIKEVGIVYCAGKDNVAVDALSCNHLQVVPVEGLARHRLLLSCHCQDLLFIKCFRKIQLLKDLSMIP